MPTESPDHETFLDGGNHDPPGDAGPQGDRPSGDPALSTAPALPANQVQTGCTRSNLSPAASGSALLQEQAHQGRHAPPDRGDAIFRLMTEARTPAELARQIAAARDRLLAFAAACPDERWHAQPLAAQGDPRPVGVIVDHVADAYDYITGWLRELVAGQNPHVDGALIDRLNAAHAARAGHLTQAGAMEHLTRSGDELAGFVSRLSAADLDIAEGRVGRLAEICARHGDAHRGDLEQALGDTA